MRRILSQVKLALYRKDTARNGTASDFCPLAGDEAVTEALKPIWQNLDLPAMAAAVVTSGGV